MSKIAIVAAMEREVRPLVKGWRVREGQNGERRFRFFENEDVVVVCGGIGGEAARRAAEAVIVLYKPEMVYSVGYAGALCSEVRAGEVVCPARVVDTGDGSSVQIPGGAGILVSHREIASPAQKRKLRDSFGAQSVDMEASAVARAAEARGIAFSAVKAISDEFDFELPAMVGFVDSDGQFQEARFALHIALRPWLWGKAIRLARNSHKATCALCDELQSVIRKGTPRTTQPSQSDQ